jgi:hypothetical protein
MVLPGNTPDGSVVEVGFSTAITIGNDVFTSRQYVRKYTVALLILPLLENLFNSLICLLLIIWSNRLYVIC